MALACLACHAMDSSTDSFRMDSFRMQNMSTRSSSSDDEPGGCGRVSSCFTKPTTKPAASTSNNNRRRSLVHNGASFTRDLGAPSSNALQRRGGGGSLASFARQQPDASIEPIGFPEPRLTRCHAVRRDLFRNFSVGDSDTEFQTRRCCFNLTGATA